MIMKYTTCDAILLFQIYYYRWKNRRLLRSHGGRHSNGERAPLLGDEAPTPDHIHAANDEPVPARILVIRYLGALLFVVAVGIAAWWLAKDEETHLVDPHEGKKWWYIQFLGWSSASLFVRAQSSSFCPGLIHFGV